MSHFGDREKLISLSHSRKKMSFDNFTISTKSREKFASFAFHVIRTCRYVHAFFSLSGLSFSFFLSFKRLPRDASNKFDPSLRTRISSHNMLAVLGSGLITLKIAYRIFHKCIKKFNDACHGVRLHDTI